MVGLGKTGAEEKRKNVTLKSAVTSIGDFLNQVRLRQKALLRRAKKDTELEVENKPTSRWFFRGQGNESWNLLPSLFRVVKSIPSALVNVNGLKCTLLDEEQFLIQDFERYEPGLFTQCANDIERMAVAQHYGIPTRLLDVSENALVALHFAITGEGCKMKDGKVFIFRASPDQYKLASTGGRVGICIQNYHKRTVNLLGNKPLLVFPPMMTSRQKVQSGSFFLFENEGNGCVRTFEDTDYETIVIPARYKKKLRKEFEEVCGVSFCTLFPDCFDYYKTRLMQDASKRVCANFPGLRGNV